MVKIPEKGPDWRLLAKESLKKVFDSQSTEIKEFIDKADKFYYPWEKIKYEPIPAGFDKEEVWSFIRFKRYLSSRPSPITDINGKEFTFWLTDEIQKNLHLIDQNTSGNLALGNSGNDAKASSKYIVTSLMEEAITSSQIEGAVAAIKEAKKMLAEKRRPKTKSEQMIYNNYQTMQSVKKLCSQDLSLELLLQLHISITKDTLDAKEDEGRFRTQHDKVRIETASGELLFIPPNAEEVKERLDLLCLFANDKSNTPFIHPVVKAIMLHFWMAYIHPFTDGNGRVARTLF
jgi:Fic family protein